MPSGNAGRSRLSFLLVALMILPSAMSLGMLGSETIVLVESDASSESKEALIGSSESSLGVPDHDDPTHGWASERGNIGEASLFYRTASYVPIQDWTKLTGEREIVGWHTLGHHYPVPSHWKSDLEEMGMECRTFYAPQGFHCNVPGISPATLMEAGVIGMFRLDSTDKIAPDLLPTLDGSWKSNSLTVGDKHVMNVVLAGSGHLSDLAKTGLEIRDFRSDRFAELVLDEKGVGHLIALNFVEWVEPKYPNQLDNEGAVDIVNADWVSDPANMGSDTLSGSGIIVGVMDSGLDEAVECSSLSHCTTANADIMADFLGRIRGVVSYTCGSCSDGPEDPHGHGTHVVGSVLGNGANSGDGEDNSGVATSAQLFMQSVLTSAGGLQSVDYEDFFQEAYDAGARVHTNSWGVGPDACGNSGCSGSWAYYSSDTMELDTEANNFEDLTILFAMGNDGMDCNYNSWDMTTCTGGKDGEINLGAMNRQATAKNILSIGASENFRPDQTRQYQTFCTNHVACPKPWSDERHGTNPIAIDATADEPEGMAAFSNRGPTNDDRIKPDLVAPGTYILSTCSTQVSSCANPGGAAYYDGSYTFKRGTSMATPITAGSVALLLEHLNNIEAYNCKLTMGPTNNNCPDSALVKAILSAGAHDMEGQYSSGGDGVNGAVESAPNNHEGWGRVDLQGAIGAGFTSGIDITTSESHSFMLTIPSTGLESFRVVLGWNDPVNSASSGKQLINDLDIHLKSPSGALQSYSNDDVNNLVGITIGDFPEAGNWEVVVTGENVPSGPQKYYIASSAGVLTDMRHPVSDVLNEPGFQSGSIFTETTMSTGGSHVCTIFDDTSLQCWGDNSFGQLGDGTTTDRLTMTQVGLDEGRTAVSISAGRSHSCAIQDNGELVCWGRNNFGQLGDGTNGQSNSPVEASLSGVPVQVSSGDWHSCAILNDASIECWGRNGHGQLGDGTNTDSSVPVSVSLSGGKALAVSAGANHTCAVLNDWSLRCWGANDNGQLGVGTTASSNSPSPVTAGGDVVAVSAGGYHTCALLADSNMKCWGGNSNGQLGNGGTNQQNDASSAVYSLSGVTSIRAGSDHTCAIDSSRALHCWGSSSEGQVGDGSTSNQVTSPSTIDLGQSLGALSVSAGGSFTCVVATNDLPRCWGGHGSGPLSLGTSPSDFTVPRWTYISSSERDLNDPPDSVMNIFEVNVAGDNDGDGFPGSEDSDDNNPTVAVNCLSGSYGRFTCRDASPGYYVSGTGNTVMTAASPGHYVWITGADSQLPCDVGTYQEMSGQTSCDDALPGYYVSGTGAAEGTPCPAGKYNELPGQISDTACIWAQPGHSVPVLTQVSSGALHTCAILDDGSVKCWGDNSNGQLGDGSISESHTPVEVNMGGSEVHSISAGSYHTCAIMVDRSVRCWGDNWHGQLGDSTNSDRLNPVEIAVPSNSSAVTIDSGPFHTCLGMNDGGMFCWGFNAYGQIGNGGTSNTNSPAAVALDSTQSPTQVFAGLFHTCSLFDSGQMACWGSNSFGQLGDGTTVSQSLPNIVSHSTNALSISVGQRHTCAILDDASLKCWGINSDGQLGDGSTTSRTSPVSVDLGHGSKEQVPCSPGTYQPNGSQTSCILAERGYSVPLSGQLNQTGCTRGYYSGLKGQSSCTPAALGFFVEGFSAESQTPCPEQHSTHQMASTNSDMCMPDFDGDKIPDQYDNDADNDGVANSQDFDWLDPNVSIDSDGDSIPDSIDPDDDNDGVNDTEDLFPDDQSEWKDNDLDGVGDNADRDDDGDGRDDIFDVFPDDKEEWSDFDGDGIGDNADADDDNDGMCDHPTSTYSGPPDVDNDGEADCNPLPNGDAFPLDSLEWFDTDGDSIGNVADDDDDGDGYNDTIDAFSLDATEWANSDGDAIGDNRDAFPNDSTEWQDTDGDSVGDNSDECPYVEGINPSYENMMTLLVLPGNELGCPVVVLPGDAITIVEDEEPESVEVAVSDTADFDMDGLADIFDDDDDNDGVKDWEDGDLDPITGSGQWSKDPGRPFGLETWAMIVASVIFVGVMGYRLAGMKGRSASLLKSKRIRIK